MDYYDASHRSKLGYYSFLSSHCTVGGHKFVNSVIQDKTVLGKSIEN